MTENENASGEAQAQDDKTAPDISPASGDARVTALETERNELKDRLLRLAAEFENYKKRVRREQADGEAKVKEAVLKDMLEVIDNLERAVAFDETADMKAIQQGVNLVLRLFQQKLERHDVRPFEAKGQAFDPRVHDAISQVPSAEAPAGSVLSELQKGYRLGDRLLRPALVVVSVGAPQASSGPPPETNGSGSGSAE